MRTRSHHKKAGLGMAQLRASDAVGQDKYRITLEVQEEVFHWFDETLEPLARHGRPLLIRIGPHGRLDNIDDEGRFIKDEAFEYQGKEVLWKAGTSARGLLKSWGAVEDAGCEVSADA